MVLMGSSFSPHTLQGGCSSWLFRSCSDIILEIGWPHLLQKAASSILDCAPHLPQNTIGYTPASKRAKRTKRWFDHRMWVEIRTFEFSRIEILWRTEKTDGR